MNHPGKKLFKKNNDEKREMSLEEEVKFLKGQFEELKELQKKDTGQLKAALKASHKELKSSNSTLKDTVKSDIDLLQRMTLELHTLCQTTGAQTQASSPAKQVKGAKAFADALGPVPSQTEHRLNEIENLLAPIKQDLLIISDAIRESSKQDEESPQDQDQDQARFLNLAGLVGDDDDEHELERDIYSLFIISGNCSASFFYPLIVAAFQLLITALILIDLLQSDLPDGVPNDNIANVPAKVDWQVRCAQFVSLIIAFVTVDDMITSMKMFLLGYDRNLERENPGATHLKYVVANSIRFFEGMCTLFISVIVIIQSSNVLDIFMNFAAVAFVSELDNLAFELAEDGLCGRSLQDACERVIETKVTWQPRRCNLGYLINVVFGLLLMPFLTILLMVAVRQANGTYLDNAACNNIEVNFGDEVLSFDPGVRFSFVGEGVNKTFPNSQRILPFLEETPKALLYQYFSAVYVAEKDIAADRLVEFDSRPVYWERGVKDPISGKFYYCDPTQSWVFTIETLYNTTGAMPEESRTDCEWGWLMQSPVTSALTLDDAPTSGWNVWTGDVEEAQDFDFSCVDCSRNSDCGLTHGYCDYDTSTCVCNDKWQGRRCNQERPHCPGIIWLNYGEDSTEYSEITPYGLGKEDDNSTFIMYERPVYVIPNGSEVINGYSFAELTNVSNFYFELIMYTGRRWFDTMFSLEEIIITEDIDFHAYWDDIFDRNTIFYSDPTENYLPIGFTWYEVRDSLSQGNFGPFGASFKINAIYECLDVDCMDDDTICGSYGTCVEGVQGPVIVGNETFNGTFQYSFPRNYCECSDNFGGFYCEYAPYGPYSMEMYSEYIADPVSYYENNPHLEYLKYWVNHTNSSGNVEENASTENDGEL